MAYIECLSVSQGRLSEALEHIGVAYIVSVCETGEEWHL